MPPPPLLDRCHEFFLNQHIFLQQEWAEEVTNYIIESTNGHRLSPDRLVHLVFHQWLHTNLAVSTHPTLDHFANIKSKKVIDDPVIVQITSLVDIGSSFLSQFNKLTYEFVDNSGFDALPEDKQGDNLYRAKPSRCLLLTVSDGKNELKAMERTSIPALSMLTPPGSKLVLKPPLVCRKGILCLNSDNCQVLGGDDEELMRTGRPLEVMSRKLNRPIPKKKNGMTVPTAISIRVPPPPPQRDSDKYIPSSPPPIDDDWDDDDTEVYDIHSVPPCAPSTSRPIASVSPMPSDPPPSSSRSIPDRRSLPLTNLPSTSFSPFSQPTNTRSTASTSIRRSEVKQEEIVTISDDDEKMEWKPSKEERRSLLTETRSSPVKEDTFVTRYRALKIVTLKDALVQSKFSSSSMRKMIDAHVKEFIEPLRIVDDMWTMRVILSDYTESGLECIVHSSLLDSLVGMTTEDAKAIRVSTDMSSRKEGHRKLRNVEIIMSRLDLIYEVEFFCRSSGVTPIIRGLKTLTECLNVFE